MRKGERWERGEGGGKRGRGRGGEGKEGEGEVKGGKDREREGEGEETVEHVGRGTDNKEGSRQTGQKHKVASSERIFLYR